MAQDTTELQVLERRRERLLESLAAAIKARNEADGKMQSRYDTQREDAAQDVAMYEALIADLDQLIAQVTEVQTSSHSSLSVEGCNEDTDGATEVVVGKRVVLRFDGGEPEDYLLLDGQGGVELSTCQTLSTSSPVGQLVLGARVGEVRQLHLPSKDKTHELTINVEILEVSKL